MPVGGTKQRAASRNHCCYRSVATPAGVQVRGQDDSENAFPSLFNPFYTVCLFLVAEKTLQYRATCEFTLYLLSSIGISSN